MFGVIRCAVGGFDGSGGDRDEGEECVDAEGVRVERDDSDDACGEDSAAE